MPTPEQLKGLKGLSAQDRSEGDKIAIQQQYGDADFLVGTPSLDMSTNRQYFQGIYDTNAIAENTFQEMLQGYREKYHTDLSNISVNTSDIREVAKKVSPYYKHYQFSDYITLDNKDWAYLAAQYEATRDVYGEQAANNYLNSAIKDNVAENQPWYEQAWNGFTGMGASAVGAIISTAGALKGTYDYLFGDYEDKEYLSGWENFMSSVMDNTWSRYGNDVVTYGTMIPDQIGYYKDLGFSRLAIHETQEQEESLLSSATPWVALQSGGFTVASMLTGYGEAKIAGWMFKGLSGTAKAVQTGEKLTKTLNLLKKAEGATNKFVIPGMVGTQEGLIEGLNTKQQVLQDGLQAVQQMQQQIVAEEVNRRLSKFTKVMSPDGPEGASGTVKYLDEEGNEVNIDALYQQVWNEYLPKYNEALQQVDYAATRAGINNFYVNSAINGLINSALKASLQAPPVRRSLQNSRLFGWAQPNGRFSISGTGANTTATPVFGKAKQAWNIIKEPLGEFGEEYMQSLSDATMRGGAENSIHAFIDNKYKGDGQAMVGDYMEGDFSAAWTAFTGSLTDRETLKSGIYGAISSAMGTPTLPSRARTGRLNADGTAETTLFGRGLDEFGNQESQLHRIGRILPWRSGLTGAVRDSRIQRHQEEEQAAALQEWLRDPSNRGKFDGLVGTFNWAQAMGDAARGNDEFGYRNSTLGKTISDIFMLQKLEGTNQHEAIMNQLSEIANLEEGTAEAATFIEQMRSNTNLSTEGQSDTDILSGLKKNANQMLSMIESVSMESERLEKLLGNIDEDTKQSLIYGQLMMDDWRARGAQMREELGRISIEDSREHSTVLSPRQKEIIARYGSISEAQSQLQQIEKGRDALTEDIKALQKRKKLTPMEERILRTKKAKLKTIKNEIKKLSDVRDMDPNVNTVLNESEIMALDPISRAIMLKRGKQKLYTVTHEDSEESGTETREFYSPEQQGAIDNLIARGIQQDRDFFDKVVDLGRMENSMKTFLEQYNAILSDKDSFNTFVHQAKQDAADIATRKRYEAIASIEDYSKFAREMDKLYGEGSLREQSLITRGLRDNGNINFERYSQDRDLIQGMVEHVAESDKFKELSNNDADMLVHTLTYLTDKGVDLRDASQVVETMSLVGTDGVSEFQKYVEEVNSALPEVERTAFTSVGEALQTFNDVMDSYLKSETEKAVNSRPVEVDITAESQASPVVVPEAATAEERANPVELGTSTEEGVSVPFWDMSYNTPEGGQVTSEGAVVTQEEQPTGNTVIDRFVENSNKEVARAAEVVLNVINNAPRISEEARRVAREYVESLSENSFDTRDEFIEALNAFANARDAQSEEGTDEASGLVRQAIAKAEKVESDKKDSVAQPTGRSSFFNRKRQQIDRGNQVRKTIYNMYNGSTTGGAFIASVNIDYLRQKFSEGAIVRYYDRYRIEDAIREGVLDGNPDILFITDEDLTSEVSKDFSEYSAETALPIVVVVEHKDGPITIEGKHYQPISVMASTNKEGSAGSSHMAPIRELAQGNQGTQLVRNTDGSPIVTKLYGTPRAYPEDRNFRGRNSVIEIGIQDLTQDERVQVQAAQRSARRNHPAYQRAKRKFLSGLVTRDLGGRKALFFMQPTLQGKFNSIEVFVSPIQETVGRDTELTFDEVVAQGSQEEIISFNSRTSRAAKALENFLKHFNTEELIFDEQGGQIIAVESSANALAGMASTLEKSISNFINIPVSQGWSYAITPTDNVVGDSRVMRLSLTNSNTGEVINLTDLYQGMPDSEIEAAKVNLLKNLILDNGQVRMSRNDDSFAKWNVTYSDVNSDNKNATNNISDIYDDGILGAAATTFNYRIQGIAVQNPFRADRTPVYTQVANSNNAQKPAPINSPTVVASGQVDSNGAIVDSDTGAVVVGTPETPVNSIQDTAAKIVAQIEQDSKGISLSEDGSVYIDSKTGQRYARVTSIISADESGSRFDPGSPWATPSTNIGTGIDTFVRDFFTDESSLGETNYPNATKEQYQEFKRQLQALKNTLTANGLTVVPRDVTVTGTLDVMDNEGVVHKVNVAGTLDLLAYDSRGNFYIFDMKTNRSGIYENKRAKYARQLSLYKDFLEGKYGVKVASLNILPIKVSYPAPKGAGRGTTEYTVSDSSPNQLLVGDKEFRDARPILEPTISVPYVGLHIVWDKLSDQEREMAKGIEEAAQVQGATVAVEAAVSEPIQDPIDVTLGVNFSDNYLGSMFGDSSIGTEDFSMDFQERLTPVPDHLKWGSLTEEQRDALEMMGFNETSWSNLEDAEMEHKLGCL